MSAALLDVNVLIAFVWPAHNAHHQATRWFNRHAQQGWATCPFTQAAFVRILSNPAFSPDALTATDAISLLTANLAHPAHQFWSNTIDFTEAIRPFRNQITGHQQVTDAYLLGLAMHKKGRFVTLDRSIRALIPAGGIDKIALEVIGA